MKARHTVLSILFLTWIVSCVDRMAMSVAIPYISAEFHLSPSASGLVMSIFFAGYALSQIPGGLLADKFGARRIATIAMLWWSAFTALTGLAAGFVQMAVVRFVFGIGEGIFPACAFKTIAVWFPKKERATANALMLASNPLGVALSPLAVVGIMSIWGWRAVFFWLFVPGIVIALLFWLFIPDRPSESSRVSREELFEIEGGDASALHPGEKIGVLRILREPYVLKYFFVLFTFDIAYGGFMTWLPTYLVQARGLSMAQMGVAASLPFFAGTIGSVVGGWASDRFFSNRRRLPIVVVELMSAVLLYMTFKADTLAMMVVCQTLAGFFLMSFFSVFWALPMNTIPKELMGVAGGLINMAGQIATFISPLALGYLVGAAHGDFYHAFLLLIAALVVSSALVFTIPARSFRKAQNVAGTI